MGWYRTHVARTTMMMSDVQISTLTGRQVAERYAEQVVVPFVESRWPRMPYAVGRLGSGSEVLGLDDVTSRDHDWGLRLTLLVDADRVGEVDAALEQGLPDSHLGLPVRSSTTWDPVVHHRIEVADPDAFALSRLGVATGVGLSTDDWLVVTGQSVLEVVAGSVYRDTSGRLTRIRDHLAWYPDDVWRYVVAADWARLAQELPFVGRTADRGDDLGSRVITGRLAHTAMHLGCLLERRWAPYPKWLGTVFGRLPGAGGSAGALAAAMSATSGPERQTELATAIEALHDRQSEVGLPTAGEAVTPFFDRPYLGVDEAVAARLLDSIADERVRAWPAGVGSVEQWVDNVDILSSPARRALLRNFGRVLPA